MPPASRLPTPPEIPSADEQTPGLPADPHLKTSAAIASQLRVDPRQGLAPHQINARRSAHGPNRPPAAVRRGWLERLLDPFRDFMILVLIAAAVLSGLIGDRIDTITILLIVLLDAAVAISQAWRADRALEALRELAAPQATVVRGGREQRIQTDQLVPGDVVRLESGNRVPADLRLQAIARLSIDESTLTGESVSVDKHDEPLPAGEHPLGNRWNMAFMGTLVTGGRATGLVVATGAATQIGQVAALLRQTTVRNTPLQQRLTVFGKRLSLVVLAICALVFALGVLRGEPLLPMALTAISLAVAAIPEALPAVVTVLLALGAHRMVRVNALVRRLPAVETLGSVTTICSDKTGTLTLNRMRVRAIDSFGTAPDELLRAAALCNDARVGPKGLIGEPTETALLAHSQAAGLDLVALAGTAPRLQEWPFDAQRKRMTTLHPHLDGWRAYCKGAPESVLACCTTLIGPDGEQPLRRAEVQLLIDEWATRGLRVLAFARRDGHWPTAARQRDGAPAGGDATADGHPRLAADEGAIEHELVLLGLIGLIDPPRPQALAAVTQCHEAGIRVAMITGDHPATALAIASELGIATPTQQRVLTGLELSAMSDAQLAGEVEQIAVFARVDPAQKIRIVQSLQARGHRVAMTGDGVNDAPALRAADIGIAMGQGGTDVARESAGLVLLDDNFATIVGAVHEGRRIVDNLRKFIRYALTGNSGEIWVLLLAALMGMATPLLPIHILWVNLVTDGLPGLALAAEPAEPDIMRRPPRPPSENLFARGLWQHALGVGLLIAGLCLAVQAWASANANPHGQTMVFTVLTLAQMAHVLAIRSERESLFSQGLSGNRPLLAAVLLTTGLQLATVYVPWLQPVFRTQALSAAELALCLACAAVVLVGVEIEKAWRRR
ncbi:MAG: HAD-IC family P-type ATPase [Burkholderiales bacterium]|nr:HAD-IC family P-type ATPase [Burkholderiales bacterium]